MADAAGRQHGALIARKRAADGQPPSADEGRPKKSMRLTAQLHPSIPEGSAHQPCCQYIKCRQMAAVRTQALTGSAFDMQRQQAAGCAPAAAATGPGVPPAGDNQEHRIVTMSKSNTCLLPLRQQRHALVRAPHAGHIAEFI